MKPYTLPTEPPIGTLLKAADGTIWKSGTWTSPNGTQKTLWYEQPNYFARDLRRLSWKEMLTRNNATPLTEIPNPPKIGDSRFNAPEWLELLPEGTVITSCNRYSKRICVLGKSGDKWYSATDDDEGYTSHYVAGDETCTIIWLPEEHQ